MFLRTNFLIIAALAALCSAAPSAMSSAATTDGKAPVVALSDSLGGMVTCYDQTNWGGSTTNYPVSSSPGSCQSTSSNECSSASWGIWYSGLKCIKFYGSAGCEGKETYEVHANIQANDQFKDFEDMNGKGAFTASSLKVYNC